MKRSRLDLLWAHGNLYFGIDHGSDGDMASDFLRSEIRKMAWIFDPRKHNLPDMSAIVTNLIATLLCCEKKEMLDWVRSGLFLAQQELRGWLIHSPFVQMILEMELPTQEDVNKCQENPWNDWNLAEDRSVTAFLDKAKRLFALMEISLKMYWKPAYHSGGGKSPYWNIIPAHYDDGSYKPFLMRMENLESELKLSVYDEDIANMQLRLKYIVRRFLQRKMKFGILIGKMNNVFVEWGEEYIKKTAKASSGHLFL